MKQLHPTSLYAVELPEGKIDIRLRKESVSWLSIIAWKNVDGKKIAKSSQVGLPDGNWQFHFTTQTATEQDWAGVGLTANKKKREKMSRELQNKREPFLKAPSVSKEVALNCGIASRSNPTYLPFLSLMNFCINLVPQRYINIINQCK